LMNSGFDNTQERRLISDLDVRVLRDAYDYTVTLPSAVFFGPLHTFLVNLNFTTGELVINGDPLVKGDHITYGADINTTPVVTADNTTVALGFLPVKSIRVGPVGLGNGSPGVVSSDNDTLDLQSLPGGIVATVDAGQGNDTISVSSLAHRID